MGRLSLIGGLAAQMLVLSAAGLRAQEVGELEYAVKFVCGRTDQPMVAPGTYFTAINVHNPADSVVAVRKKVAIALPNQRPGPVSRFRDARLGPDQAFEIDCPEILRLGEAEEFAKGFVVIKSQYALDVVAMYTAAGATGLVETLEIERIPARRPSPGCPDLVVDSVMRPVWDGDNRRSVINAVIRNGGTVTATPTLARVIDPSTSQPTGAPYNDVAPTPELGPGDWVTVTFHLPYWVYNPDASLEVTADYKNELAECREDNNKREFEDIG
jgi:hypothetical protein